MGLQQPHSCQIPELFTEFLSKSRYLYCCTLDRYQRPHVVPLFFIFDRSRCSILCVTERKSKKVHNMRYNPYVSFTTDEVHAKNPLLNTGLMIETVAEIREAGDQVAEVLTRLQIKYPAFFDTRLFSNYIYDQEVLIVAHFLKLVYWRGPFFRRFNCPVHRKKESPFWQNRTHSSSRKTGKVSK
ncbi:MAG: pyridoxamine 5'-phosphate oxidase family protein [Candidatus Hodarchaeota archaeon]